MLVVRLHQINLKNGRFTSRSTHFSPFSNVSRDPAVWSSCEWTRHERTHTNSTGVYTRNLRLSWAPPTAPSPFATRNCFSTSDCQQQCFCSTQIVEISQGCHTNTHSAFQSYLFTQYNIRFILFVSFVCPSYYLLNILTTPTQAREALSMFSCFAKLETNNKAQLTHKHT